ncbi:MAG: hypothetical protein GEU83_17640 [Pseudonocardiaceae bacterium]|nr:hypothetical protein [Pseudonocardiaceae bacterium]
MRPEGGDDLYTAMNVIDGAFPPVAIGTLVTGVLLSLGTKWGLLRHYWVATKLVLALAVIVTAVGFSDRLVQQSLPSPAGGPTDGGAVLCVVPLPTTLLLLLSVAHLLMLAVATVVSVYKPWGKTRWGRPSSARGR